MRADLRLALRRAEVVLLAGPRQCGKTTLAREVVPPGSPGYFDLEDPVDVARLAEPMTALAGLLTSLSLVELQTRCDERFGVTLDPTELGYDNGDTVRQLFTALADR